MGIITRDMFEGYIEEIDTHDDVRRVDGPAETPGGEMGEGEVMLRTEDRATILALINGMAYIESYERTPGQADWELTDCWEGPITKFGARLELEYEWLI